MSELLPKQKMVLSGSAMSCAEQDMAILTMSHIAFYMGFPPCTVVVGTLTHYSTSVETLSVTCYLSNGKQRSMLATSAMLLGEGAEVKNAASVLPSESVAVVSWVPARICRLYLLTILVLLTHLISMLSMSLNTMLHRCELCISQGKGRRLFYGSSRRTGP